MIAWRQLEQLGVTRSRVIVEADCFQFHSGREAWDNDVTRYNDLALHGWTVVRLTETDLKKRAGAFARALAKVVGTRPRASRNGAATARRSMDTRLPHQEE